MLIRLVLIRLVLTEIQRFKNVKISKEMYCHPAPVVRKPNQIKMADLHFVDFALIPSPARKEKPQFRLPDDLFDLILSRTSIPLSVFPRFFEFSHRRQTAVRRSVLEMFYTTRAKQESSTFPLSEVEIVA